MAIHSDQNPYPGVNPHLNSALQNQSGGWKGFHKKHSARIDDELECLLPDGYYVANEQSIQIGTYDPLTE